MSLRDGIAYFTFATFIQPKLRGQYAGYRAPIIKPDGDITMGEFFTACMAANVNPFEAFKKVAITNGWTGEDGESWII